MSVLRSHGLAPVLCGLLLSAGIGLSGCGTTASAHNEVVRVPVYGTAGGIDPGIFDPARASTATSLFLSSMFDSGLVKFSPDLHVIPELAVSIPTISGTGRAYTFTIRQDARFADGRHCTAYDVAYSLSRALRPGVGSTLAHRFLGGIIGASAVESGAAALLSGVQVLGRLTVRIRLAAPDATFLDKLAFPVASVVEPGSTDRHGPAGLGPWSLSGVEPDGTAIAVPRAHYYGGQLQLRQIVLVPAGSETNALSLYRQNIVDLAEVPAADFRMYVSRADFDDSSAPDAYYAIPSPAIARQLVARLDRAQLATAVGPSVSPLDSVVPPSVPDYVASSPVPDPAKGPSMTAMIDAPLIGPSPRGELDPILRTALARQWPPSLRTAPVRLIHLDFALPDPGVWLRLVLAATGSRWYRSMLLTADTLTDDPVMRMNDYGIAENWALGRGLVIPLLSSRIGYLVKPSVDNLQITALGPMPLNNNWTLVSTS